MFYEPKYVMVRIYILQLAYNKYYVGKSNNPASRILDHFENKGAAWTSKYKPIRILKIHENCDDGDEDKYVIKYMSKYGVDNVRGGTFSRIRLDDSEKKVLRKMIYSQNDRCFGCGNRGHFIAECPNNKKYSTSSSSEVDSYNELKLDSGSSGGTDTDSTTSDESSSNNVKINDENTSSFAETVVSGVDIIKKKIIDYGTTITGSNQLETDTDQSLICHRCNRKGHVSIKCTYDSRDDGSPIRDHRTNCYRCGRTGHWRATCYEGDDIYGNKLSNKNDMCSIM